MTRRAPLVGAAIVLLSACAPAVTDPARPAVETTPVVPERTAELTFPVGRYAVPETSILALHLELTLLPAWWDREAENSMICAYRYEFPSSRMYPRGFRQPSSDRLITIERLGRKIDAASRRITDVDARMAFDRKVAEPFRLLRERYGEPAGR